MGANRSGTSLVSHLISQHPEVQGLYNGNSQPVYLQTGHANAYAESMHIWQYLAPAFKGIYRVCWAHSRVLKYSYRDGIRNSKEEELLSFDFLRNNPGIKRPLVKNNYNTLRVPLIKQLFPGAVFVFVFRNKDDYVNRSFDKWEKEFGLMPSDKAKIINHWLNANLHCISDLERLCKDEYVMININELLSSRDSCMQILDKSIVKLGLNEFSFDLENVKFSKNKDESEETARFIEAVKNISA